MALRLHDLTARTRELMLPEILMDEENRGIYISRYLNPLGTQAYVPILKEAASQGSDASMAQALRAARAFSAHHMRKGPQGRGMVQCKVPTNAADTLSQSQFNMYYIRAICLRAIEEGREIEIYRAQHSENPRPESERMIGTRPDPEHVLQVLRETKGVEPSIGIPMPNSGLSVRLV